MAGSFACKSNAGVAPQEQLLGTMAGNRRLSIGLPAEHNGGEKRFPLTPEGGCLVDQRGVSRFCGKRSRRGVSSIPIYIIPRLGRKRQQPQKFSDAMSFLKLLR